MKIKDVAKLAGVSPSTVSKIVNNKAENINPETRKRVLQIVKEYNYVPYSAIKSTTSTKSLMLGILLTDIEKSSQLLSGMISAAQAQGYGTIVLDSQNNPELEMKHLTVFLRNKVDGILWEPISQKSYEHIALLEEHNIEYLLLDSSDHNHAFHIDFSHLGYLLTQKMIEFKHNNIACFLHDDSKMSNQFLTGYEKCLYDHDISFSEQMIFYNSMISQEQYIHHLLTQNISGILCSNPQDASDLYHTLIKYHYSLPSDFSILCLKNEKNSLLNHSHISGIQIPYYEFGMFVCKELIQKCEAITIENKNPVYEITGDLTDFSTIDKPLFFKKQKIVVVGSIHSDTTFTVNRLPQSGKTITIHNLSTSPGGKGLNQAVGAARLGQKVALIGDVGNDLDALVVYNLLEKEQIISHGVRRDKQAQTGKAYIYLKNDGESAITILPGANNNLSIQDIQERESLFHNASYCLLSTEVPIDTVIEAAKIAHIHGAQNILKPAALKKMPEELLSYIDILIINEKEADIFCQEYTTVEQKATFFFNKGVKTVILTLGSNGCYLKSNIISQLFPAADFPAVDTTGGADSFISAFAAYMNEGYPLVKAIQIASYAAGFCISRQGVIPSLADKNTLENHISKIEPTLL